MSVTNQIIFCTVRMEAETITDGEITLAYGTGFFVSYDVDDGKNYTVVVTNKHVIEGARKCRFYMTLSKMDEYAPDYGNLYPITVTNIDETFIPHPDPDVDIAICTISGALQNVVDKGKRLYFRQLRIKDFLDADSFNNLSAVENTLMVGYPIGLSDQANNLPIVRRGITATPPYIDFEKKPQFVIDCACFPGSSGSPVFVTDEGVKENEKTELIPFIAGVRLLGILFAGPMFEAEGDVTVVTTESRFATTKIPINLGYCVKAEKLFYFESILSDLYTHGADYVRDRLRTKDAYPA